MNIMHTMASEARTIQVPKRRRFYRTELKLQVVQTCARPGVHCWSGFATRHQYQHRAPMDTGTTTMVQCACIRAVQAQFSITTFEAMRYLDCYDPRARVMQLRNAGEVIDTHWQTIITESGDKHRVGLYAMGRKQ